MDGQAPFNELDGNPLVSADPTMWDRLIEAVGPASMLVAIEGRMGVALRARVAADDVWQETLLHAWRDRARCEWRGPGPFRRWLLQVAENRIRDFDDHFGAVKRGGGVPELPLPETGDSRSAIFAGPLATTTPSRVASDRERADLFRAALGALPDELRDVVRLRLFEDLGMEEVAARLDLGVEAVRHRFRRGARLYHERLQALTGSDGRAGGLLS